MSNKNFIPRQYQILDGQEWKNISWRKGREMELSGKYLSLELYDNDANYKANGLIEKSTDEQPKKFEDLEKGLNKLMNKYNK